MWIEFTWKNTDYILPNKLVLYLRLGRNRQPKGSFTHLRTFNLAANARPEIFKRKTFLVITNQKKKLHNLNYFLEGSSEIAPLNLAFYALGCQINYSWFCIWPWTNAAFNVSGVTFIDNKIMWTLPCKPFLSIFRLH